MVTRRRTEAATAISADERKWRARSDADTLRSAAEIMADKGRMKDAHAHIKEQVGAMERVLKTGAPPDSRKVSPKPPAPKAKDGRPATKPEMKAPQPPKAKAK